MRGNSQRLSTNHKTTTATGQRTSIIADLRIFTLYLAPAATRQNACFPYKLYSYSVIKSTRERPHPEKGDIAIIDNCQRFCGLSDFSILRSVRLLSNLAMSLLFSWPAGPTGVSTR